MTTFSLRYLLFLGVITLVFSSCGVFTNQYSYNSSRGGSTTNPDRTRNERERNNSRDNEEDEELLFEDEEVEVAEKEELEKPPIEKPDKIERGEDAQLRESITDYARTHLGIKYVYGGKTPDGFDCSGFTRYVMKNFDIELPGVSSYQAKRGVKVKSRKAKPGDLVFFKRSAVGEVFHVALIIDNNPREGITVIHSASRGVVIENITKSSYWSPKIAFVRNVL